MTEFLKLPMALLALLAALTGCNPSEKQTAAPATSDVAEVPAVAMVDSEELARWEETASRVTIQRDRWGIPHINGETDADTVFGTVYAQAEDDFYRLETNYINAMGRLAEAEGEQELFRDLRMKLFIEPTDIQAQYEASPPWLQELMVAFADGLNYFLHTHPEIEPRVIDRFEPWMALTFTEGSIGGDIERVNLQELQAFYDERNMIAQAEAIADGEPRGSNGFAIAPQNSATGNALLLINPHTSFFFRSELHMISEEGLNAYGAVTWGQFFVYQGFNENTGWMHTSSRADAIDEYLLDVTRREDGYYYRYGEGERRLQERLITLPYRDGEVMRTREITAFFSHHGPVIREQDGQWVAIKLMQEPIRALTQSYTRTKANNYAEFNASMELLTNSSNNTVYADSDGNIAYYHGNFIPVRDPGFDWNSPLDGGNPATEWQGLHPVDEIITLFNPATGWIQNTNNTPFNAAGDASPRPEDYPAYMANNPESFRGVHAVQVLQGVDDFTVESLLDAAYDPTLTAFEVLIPRLELLTAVPTRPDSPMTISSQALEYIDLLREWDYQYSLESTETSLAVFWAQNLLEAVRADAAAQGINVYDYMVNNATDRQVLNALRSAAETLENDFGDWQVPWGEINRYQRLTGDLVQDFDDDAPSIPVPFASGRWGSLASFGARTYPGTRRMYGTSGNSFVAAVEFGERVRARAITVGGLSNDPDSPHFDDQAQMYAEGEFRDVLFYPEDITANLEREYQPGQ
jgi:acyl-homoserine-lactone acylase